LIHKSLWNERLPVLTLHEHGTFPMGVRLGPDVLPTSERVIAVGGSLRNAVAHAPAEGSMRLRRRRVAESSLCSLPRRRASLLVQFREVVDRLVRPEGSAPW
jgi:hypothetical protein